MFLNYNPSNIFAHSHAIGMTEYSPAKAGEYMSVSNFQNHARCKKYFKANRHNHLHLVQKYAQILFCPWMDIICSLKLTVFLNLCSQKTVCFMEKIMPANK